MGLIENILGLPGDVNRPDKSGGVNRKNVAKSAPKSDSSKGKVVKTDISQEAWQLYNLKSQAAQFVDKVKQAETLSTREIEEIQQRISSQYYFDSEVIDKVVDKLLRTVKVQKLK